MRDEETTEEACNNCELEDDFGGNAELETEYVGHSNELEIEDVGYNAGWEIEDVVINAEVKSKEGGINDNPGNETLVGLIASQKGLIIKNNGLITNHKEMITR